MKDLFFIGRDRSRTLSAAALQNVTNTTYYYVPFDRRQRDYREHTKWYPPTVTRNITGHINNPPVSRHAARDAGQRRFPLVGRIRLVKFSRYVFEFNVKTGVLSFYSSRRSRRHRWPHSVVAADRPFSFLPQLPITECRPATAQRRPRSKSGPRAFWYDGLHLPFWGHHIAGARGPTRARGPRSRSRLPTGKLALIVALTGALSEEAVMTDIAIEQNNYSSNIPPYERVTSGYWEK